MAIPNKGNNLALIRWALRKATEGEALLREQQGYDLIGPCLERMTSRVQSNIQYNVERPAELATTTSNRFKKVILEWVAAQTDIKPFWEIKTYNKRFDAQADIVSKLSAYWYTKSHADQRGLATSLRWSAVAGTGYIHLHFDPRTKDIRADGLDPRDVLPIGAMPPWDTTQDWQGLIIRERKTVYATQELFPDFAYLIIADRTEEEGSPLESTRAGRILAEINNQARSPFADVLFSDKPKSSIGRQPTVDVFTMYVKDDSTNDSNSVVEMGEFIDDPTWTKPEGVMGLFAKPNKIPANTWSYEVKPKEPLYPRGRQVMFTRSVVLYDGPSLYWHGQFPVIKLTPDPWVSGLLGLAPGWDLLSLQSSLDWNLRVIDDHNAQVAQPGVAGDEMSLGPNGLKSVNTRRSGLKVLVTPMGKPPTILTPPPLDAAITNHIEWIMHEMDDVAGLVDLKNLNQLNQIPSSETIDKMIESKSYLLQGRSRVIESFMREFAEQMMYNFAQFYTAKMRYTILGPSGVMPEDFDFDPGTFIPDFVHSEDYDEFGQVTQDAMDRGPQPRYNRAREVLRQLTFYIAPGSLLNASDVTRKLMYLQLFRMGVLDYWTLFEILGIPNAGVPPDGARTIDERLVAQARMGIGAPPSPVNSANPSAGRKPVAQTMPHLEHNGSTIAESK